MSLNWQKLRNKSQLLLLTSTASLRTAYGVSSDDRRAHSETISSRCCLKTSSRFDCILKVRFFCLIFLTCSCCNLTLSDTSLIMISVLSLPSISTLFFVKITVRQVSFVSLMLYMADSVSNVNIASARLRTFSPRSASSMVLLASDSYIFSATLEES